MPTVNHHHPADNVAAGVGVILAQVGTPDPRITALASCLIGASLCIRAVAELVRAWRGEPRPARKPGA